MKIMFFCGSLEWGRDGVGDYTRQLAIELIKIGHQVAAIGLFDRGVSLTIEEMQQVGSVELPVYRIPFSDINTRRFSGVNSFIKRFKPEVISLQYVPYSFHNKGLSFTLVQYLKAIETDAKWHIMFHELWIGSGNSFKSLLYASLQKRIIKGLNRQLKPTIVHTNLPIYYSKLKRLRFNVLALPLYSNIPVQAVRRIKDNETVFRIGVFSQVDLDRNIFCFIQDIRQVLSNKKLMLEFLLIGDNNKIKMFGAMLEKLLNGQAYVKYTGFLESDELSLAIQRCDIGLTSVPWHALGKSGSVAAFISHGIPVAAPNIDYSKKPQIAPFFSGSFCSAIIKNANYSKICEAKEAAHVVKDDINISNITRKFLADIIDSSF